MLDDTSKARWSQRLTRIVRQLATLRVAPLYAVAVLVVWLVMEYGIEAERARERIFLANSTNVDNLEDHHYFTLISSAFFVDRDSIVVPLGALLVVVAVAELSWGWKRTTVVLLAGHVVGSLVVYVGLRVALMFGSVPKAVVTANDVGISFAFGAVSAAVIFLLPRWWRWLGIGVLGLAAIPPLVLYRGVSDVGHLVAAVIGLVCGALLSRRQQSFVSSQ